MKFCRLAILPLLAALSLPAYASGIPAFVEDLIEEKGIAYQHGSIDSASEFIPFDDAGGTSRLDLSGVLYAGGTRSILVKVSQGESLSVSCEDDAVSTQSRPIGGGLYEVTLTAADGGIGWEGGYSYDITLESAGRTIHLRGQAASRRVLPLYEGVSYTDKDGTLFQLNGWMEKSADITLEDRLISLSFLGGYEDEEFSLRLSRSADASGIDGLPQDAARFMRVGFIDAPVFTYDVKLSFRAPQDAAVYQVKGGYAYPVKASYEASAYEDAAGLDGLHSFFVRGLGEYVVAFF